ncbi:hypothetical protein PHMEG_00019382 [Phytophthora megakarya]|uniref:Retrotransposon gag domain-containing protein n=1 Tax=Phytophthora megakarya TaxID=4795 RepID=A0A225VRQ0_9STRA|nr:hypothetical protein PHMEG_00019382 [Phytophthora megakarya]
MMEHSEQFQTLRINMDLMSAELQNQQTGLAELRASVASVPQTAGGAEVAESAELYPEWYVLGNMPPNTPVYTVDELEFRIEKSFKQKETPILGGEDEEDIDVYRLDVSSGDRRSTVESGAGAASLKKMRQRLVTKSREEDQVGRLFDCTQGSRSLDKYIEEFVRLSRTEEGSVNFKMILFKKGLKSQDLRNFLQTKPLTTLDGLVDAARSMNPRESRPDLSGRRTTDTGDVNTENTGQGRKSTSNSSERKPDGPRCTSTFCTEQGHTRDRCWKLHPELQPKWLKNKKNNAASTTSTSSAGRGDGVPGPAGANQNSQPRVFDPGKDGNRMYFQKRCKHLKPAKYLIKDTVCVWIKKRSTAAGRFLTKAQIFVEAVRDLGHFVVTYANGTTEQVPNRVIHLTIAVDNMEPFAFDFNICYIPNKCDVMLGVPWKRIMVPIIDWEADKIYSKQQYHEEIERQTKSDEGINEQNVDAGNEGAAPCERGAIHRPPVEKSSYYCARWGFTKHMSLKTTRKLIRKTDVEFMAVIPPETVNALHVEVLQEQGYMRSVASAAAATEKQQRQLVTDLESFKDNPGFSLLQEFSMIFRTELPVGPPVHGEHEMEVKEGTGAVYKPQ